MRLYICEHCGNIIETIKESGVLVVCCGQKMTLIEAGATDAAVEKHVPVYEVKDGIVSVTVGEVTHPMTDAHYIEWIALETNKGSQRKALTPADGPKAGFALCEGEEVKAVYAYCNLHGLWKA